MSRSFTRLPAGRIRQKYDGAKGGCHGTPCQRGGSALDLELNGVSILQPQIIMLHPRSDRSEEYIKLRSAPSYLRYHFDVAVLGLPCKVWLLVLFHCRSVNTGVCRYANVAPTSMSMPRCRTSMVASQPALPISCFGDM